MQNPVAKSLKISKDIKKISSWVWWCIAVILACTRMWQKGHELEASLGYSVSPG